ncbi:hypothetical protein ABZZ79_09345 [Streptomyces sp. NPDC006458]|uniref:hypothetical protein n=1 Tax=Streptomyces sp. NPDC006458 TaxID=3154302 RepID=UPI0033B0AD2D
MRPVLEVLGFLALAQGGLGLLHEWVHWDVGLVQRLGFLDGYEIYASVALVVLGIALFARAGSREEN